MKKNCWENLGIGLIKEMVETTERVCKDNYPELGEVKLTQLHEFIKASMTWVLGESEAVFNEYIDYADGERAKNREYLQGLRACNRFVNLARKSIKVNSKNLPPIGQVKE